MAFSSTRNGPKAVVGTILADRYRIEEMLGQGGMGTVYRAEHIHMRKSVALKVLHPEIAKLPEIAARFEREAVAAGRIEHRNVAKAMDFGKLADGSFYLVIEYVKGESLTALVKRGPLAPAAALDIVRQIAEALKAAHAAGIVHRDLKPDNVMIADAENGAGCVKVLDFGVAKLVSEATGTTGNRKLTHYGMLIGTPEYMSPEQAGGSVVDHRADLYALGVILYELLSGHPPFQADDQIGILGKHFIEPPPPLPDTIPRKTQAIVFALLEKEAEARIQSAAELVERIEQAHAELDSGQAVSEPEPAEAIAATLEGVPRSAEKKRRGRWLAPMLSAAALALLAVAGLAIVRGFGNNAGRALTASFGLETPASATPAPSEQPPLASAEAPAPSSEPPAPPSEPPAPSSEPATVSNQAPAASAGAPAPSAQAETEEVEVANDANEPTVERVPTQAGVTAIQDAPRKSAPKLTTGSKKRPRYIIRRRIIRRTIITRR